MTDLTALDETPDTAADALTLLAPCTVAELHRRAIHAYCNSPVMAAVTETEERLHTAWYDLRAWVAGMADGGTHIDPRLLLARMDMLRRAAKQPIQDWMDQASTPKDGTP